MSNNRLAVLAGNGISIAANPNFQLTALTELIRAELATLDQGAFLELLHKQHSTLGYQMVLSADFEEFVGAMYDRYLDLRNLEDLLQAQYGQHDPKTVHLRNAAEVVWKVSRKAVAAVLRVIGDQSACALTNTAKIDAFVQEIEHKFSTRADFFTVNYDNLLLESLLRVYTSQRMYDLAFGDAKTLMLSNGQSIQSHLLRTSVSDFGGLGLRVGLFHLHGSVAYWRSGEKGPDFKVPKGDILTAQLLKSEIESYESFRPLVLLGRWPNKWQAVKQQPFSLAYQLLESKLEMATHILIAGSSLREEAILEQIALAISRSSSDAKRLAIFVVDTKLVARVDFERIIGRFVQLDHFGFEYFASSSGIEGLPSDPDWVRFCEFESA